MLFLVNLPKHGYNTTGMRIILSKEEIKGERIALSGEKAKYLISVMRCRAGDELQVFDGEGSFYKAKVFAIANRAVKIDLLEKLPCDTESPLNIILVQGILKGEKMDLVIQKTTELGVKEIFPAITERSQVRHTRKKERWRKISEEASRQCGRTEIPIIHEPVEFSSWLMAYGAQPINGFIFWEEVGMPLREAMKKIQSAEYRTQNTDKKSPDSLLCARSSVNIAIGPEGGFTNEEVALANSKGLITVSLGKRILRAETAAISALTLVQFLIGDI